MGFNSGFKGLKFVTYMNHECLAKKHWLTACFMYDALHGPFTSPNTKNMRKEKQSCHLLQAVKSTHFQRQNDIYWYSSFITTRP